MKQVLRFLFLFLLISLPLKIDAQLNKFLVQTYFEEGYETQIIPPWRNANISVRESYFNGLRDFNFNNIQLNNLSYWKKPRDYTEKYIMANNAGLSTIIVNDSIASKYDEFGIYYHSSPFNYDKSTALLDRLLSNSDYNIIGFNFSDEPRTAYEQDFNVIEHIPPYSNFVKQRNSDLLRYANLSSRIPQSARYNREDYIQKYIDIADPNLLSFDHHPAIYLTTYNCFFESLYDFGIKSVENSIPLMYTLMPFKDSIAWESLTQQGNEINSARSLSMFNYLIYASLAYGAKGISYWPGFQWVVNAGRWDFTLKFDVGELDAISSLHKKIIDHSNTLLDLNFASAYHRSINSTIGIQFGKTVERLYDFNLWNNIVNDKYAIRIFRDPLKPVKKIGGVSWAPSSLVITFQTNSQGLIYYWVFNKDVQNSLDFYLDIKNNMEAVDVLNDFEFLPNLQPIHLEPGEAKLFCSNTYWLNEYSITNYTYNGDIPSTVFPGYHDDEDHLYPFESANQITLGSDVSFESNSTKSFMANQIVLSPGVTIHQGSTVRLSSYKNSNNTTGSLLRSAKIQKEEQPLIEMDSKPIVYPNPTRDFFKVKAILPEKVVIEIKVYNNMGRLVKVEKSKGIETTISLQNEPEGIYHVHFMLNNKTYNFKVVKM